MQFPMEMRDLLIEQGMYVDNIYLSNICSNPSFTVFLCGLCGYAEFLEKHWLLNILAWQHHPSGCYKYYSPTIKRSANRLKDNCSDHMSGLAIAALSQFLKIYFFH